MYAKRFSQRQKDYCGAGMRVHVGVPAAHCASALMVPVGAREMMVPVGARE
jgi:hypothetical protein